jgi:hypothetical protein
MSYQPNARCKSARCNIELYRAWNPVTQKIVPLEKITAETKMPAKPVRYDLEIVEGNFHCTRNDEAGEYLNHYATCPDASNFNRSKKKK